MLNFKSHIALVLGAIALFTSSANAHGILSKPKSVMIGNGDSTKYPAVIDSTGLDWPGPFNQDPPTNTKNFWIGFNSSNFKNLRELVTEKAKIDTPGATIEYGITDPKAPPQPLPSLIQWSHSDSEGFTPSHNGPCQALCDDVVVFQDENCPVNFPMAPAEMRYDMEACKGASLLTFYWIALHTPMWQCYISCAPLEGGTGGTTSNATTPTITPPATPPSAEAQVPVDDSAAAASPSAPPAKAQSPPAEAPSPPAEVPSPPAEAPSSPAAPSADTSAPPASPVKSDDGKGKAKCARRRRTRE